MAFDMNQLGPIYGKLGFDTPGAVITARIAGAAAAAAGLTKEQFVPIVRAALGLNTTPEETAPFRTFFSDDPTFNPAADSPEMLLLTSGVLVAAMEDWPPAAQSIPLLAATGLFGGLRDRNVYPDFRAIAERELSAVQQATPSGPDPLGPLPALATTKAAEAILQKAAADVPAMAKDIATLIASLANHSASQDEKLRGQVNALAARVTWLSEQMEMQWWVANGYSEDGKAPFAKIATAEAVVRAARELADLTSRRSGVTAAPALLDRVLELPKKRVKITLSTLATGSPLTWRRTWVAETLQLPDASLCPVTYALRLATEAGDQPDWEGRFERETGVAPRLELEPLEWALQLYREALCTKALT